MPQAKSGKRLSLAQKSVEIKAKCRVVIDRFAHEKGPRPARRHDTEPADFEPFAEILNLRGSADAVRSFDDDELPFDFTHVEIGQSFPEEYFSFPGVVFSHLKI